ncbi:MAG: hypothetical protein SFV23_01925 [Planctomycetaceae bacterium]|nr:hypothetical protein [Planctomycetaceae bacterium]
MLPLPLLYCQVTWSILSAAAVQPAHPIVLTDVCRYTFDRNSDRDLDDLPDGWVRRKGAAFPHYINAEIDHTTGVDDESSLRIDVSGGGALYYSPLLPIDALHTYYFSGHVRTDKLVHDAAMLSISLLDHRRQRVQRILSRAVTGRHGEWVPVQLGPITPHVNVRFAVIGCHLVPGPGDIRDIGGHVWFDNLHVGRLPRMELESNFYRHFVSGSTPVELSCNVSGLDPGHRYELDCTFRNLDGALSLQKRIPVEEDVDITDRRVVEFLKPQRVAWKLETQPPGFYFAAATLLRDGTAVASQETTLVILSLVQQPRKHGEFGWTVASPLHQRELTELPQIAAQAGVNWVKYPLWQTAEQNDLQASSDLAAALDQLVAAHVSPVAMLSEPPPKLRAKFAKNWHGVNEIFSLPPEFWEGSLEPVVARYSSSVRHWQLGSERDTSFLGSSILPQTLNNTRQRIQRISLNAQLGIPWRWESSTPDKEADFVSIATNAATTADELRARLESADWAQVQRWVLLRLSQLSGANVSEKAGQLARLMVAAKTGGAERIFVDDVYNNEHGLLHEDGSPRELFIPWRTTALLLQDASYLGAFAFPQASPNAVFAKDGQVTVIVWNDEPTTESLYLGVDPVELDLWGRSHPLPADPVTGECRIDVGPIPRLLTHCSEPVARWRIAARFGAGRMQSIFGGHKDSVRVTNTFSQGVSGELTLVLPDEWEAEPRTWSIAAETGETLDLPTFLRLPPTANLGQQMTMWDFKITADRPYRFRVYQPYTVGLDDLQIEVIDRRLPDGRLEIEQVVTNRTNPLEKLDFRCSLFIPDARRQKLQITKLGQGSDRKFYYLPDAERYRNRELWLRLEEDGGQRIINYRWNVGKEW